MPLLIGNPIYHWTALELKRYFDIDEPLSEKNAKEVWDKCNEYLKREDFSAQNLIKKSNVEVICTTDDIVDDLFWHKGYTPFLWRIALFYHKSFEIAHCLY